MNITRLRVSIGLTFLFSVACSEPPPTRSAFECSADSQCGAGVCTDEGQCTCPDQSCPSGSYCGANLCWQDCTASGGGCRDGQTCTAEGRCIANPNAADPDSGGFGDDCPGISVDLSNEPPTVMILVDRSGSMDFPLRNGDDNGPTRWDAVEDALVGEEGVVTQRDSSVYFGTSLYNSNGGNRDGRQCPILRTQQPMLGNLAPIRGLFQNNGPSKDTPTAESIEAITDSFPATSGSRVILLATDGNPDSCEDPDSNDEPEPKRASEEAVQRAFSMGISTQVLSVGVGVVDRQHLERLARAGAGQDLDSGSAVPYETDDPTTLANTFSNIVDQVRNCQFGINGSVDANLAGKGRVILDGNPLTYGEDWQLASSQTLELIGASCEAFKAADNPALDASFPCGSVVLR